MAADLSALREIHVEPIYNLYTSGSFHFIVLGCGGTGSAAIPKICRAVASLSTSGIQRHDITICDGDIVEDKNLIRQNFYKADIAKNKAEIMALKCSTLFGLTVRAFPEYVEDEAALVQIVESSSRIPFIIGCVDNNATRQMIHKVFSSWRRAVSLYYLDSGNEEFSGQVVLGRKAIRGNTFSPCTPPAGSGFRNLGLFNLPDVTHHYPDMLEDTDKFASQISCAEHAVSDPQAASTNEEAANIIYQMVSNCLRGGISYHWVTFNVLKSNRTVKFNTKSLLESYKINLPTEEAAEWFSDTIGSTPEPPEAPDVVIRPSRAHVAGVVSSTIEAPEQSEHTFTVRTTAALDLEANQGYSLPTLEVVYD